MSTGQQMMRVTSQAGNAQHLQAVFPRMRGCGRLGVEVGEPGSMTDVCQEHREREVASCHVLGIMCA